MLYLVGALIGLWYQAMLVAQIKESLLWGLMSICNQVLAWNGNGTVKRCTEQEQDEQ